MCLCLLCLGLCSGHLVCTGHGYHNQTSGLCVCMKNHYGSACQYKHCPFGASWFADPVSNNTRATPYAQCSDMGYCNPFTGLCECRDYYAGRACERLSCPTLGLEKNTKLAAASAITVGAAGGALISAEFTVSASIRQFPCSGHGVCKSMREASEEFNGLTLTKAPVFYDNWDADKIQVRG